jgi:tRNA G18 (ribose-2'-O)-methylase SpoU
MMMTRSSAVVTVDRLRRLQRTAARRCSSVVLLFEGMSNPSNGEAVMRTADGYGLLEVA